jgi:hypothetical protein
VWLFLFLFLRSVTVPSCKKGGDDEDGLTFVDAFFSPLVERFSELSEEEQESISLTHSLSLCFSLSLSLSLCASFFCQALPSHRRIDMKHILCACACVRSEIKERSGKERKEIKRGGTGRREGRGGGWERERGRVRGIESTSKDQIFCF